MPSEAARKAIASGEWGEKKDPKSGKTYYVNKKTKKTTWDLDAELAKTSTPAKPTVASPASKASADPVAAALASGEWAEKKDPKTGKSYYVNKKSKKTTWDLHKELGVTTGGSSSSPASAATGKVAASPSTAGASDKPLPGAQRTLSQVLAEGEWVPRKDPKTDRTFYFNKKTKKASWDLAKELGLVPEKSASPAESSDGTAKAVAATAAPAAPTEEEMERQGEEAVKKAIASGEWGEKKDPKSGKTYYVNKKTKKTTWDLQKELGVGKYAPRPAVVSSAVDGAAPLGKAYTAKEAIARGEWREGNDFGGTTYYVNNATGETTADLDLYLQIRQALDAADETNAGGGGSGATADASTAAADAADSSHMSEWVSLILRAPGHESAADKLIGPHIQRRLAEAERAVAVARQAEDDSRAEVARLEGTVAQLRKSLASHQHEIHQLQCAVFYGLGQKGTGARAAGSSATPPYAPPTMDPIAAASGSSSSLAKRVEYLEQLLDATQGHNRKLQEELEDLRRRGYEAATCRHVRDNDPWQRVLRAAVPLAPSAGLRNHGDAVRHADPAVPAPLDAFPQMLRPPPPTTAGVASYDALNTSNPNTVGRDLTHDFSPRRQHASVAGGVEEVNLHRIPPSVLTGSPVPRAGRHQHHHHLHQYS